MMSDKIEEIRERNLLKRISQKEPEIAIRELYYDLVTLAHLAERQFDKIQQLRAENERLCNEDTKTRHALGGWVWVCPDGGDEPTHERVAAVVAEVERLRAEIERLRENVDRAGKEVERADRLRAEIARVKSDERENRAEIERLRVKNERLRERLLQERAALVLDEIGAALERERVLRAALTDMMSGWRYIRDTYGDLAGVGWDRVEQKAREALEGKS